MPTQDDLKRLLDEEDALQFPYFDAEVAWRLGSLIRDTAAARGQSIAVDISKAGQQLFFAAVGEATANNSDWVRRKRATVVQFQHSTLFKQYEADVEGKPFHTRYALPDRDFAAAGGGFPIIVRRTGCVGAVVVSGLPSAGDHALVTDSIRTVLAELA